jgi:hypothetical protein
MFKMSPGFTVGMLDVLSLIAAFYTILVENDWLKKSDGFNYDFEFIAFLIL